MGERERDIGEIGLTSALTLLRGGKDKSEREPHIARARERQRERRTESVSHD